VLTISASKPDTFIFMENAQYNLYAQGGFTPTVVAPPIRLTRTGAPSSSLSAGGVWTGTVLSSYWHLEFHIKGKGIQQSHKIKKIHLSNQKYNVGTVNNSAEHQRIKRPCF
jgi:hypothetical protein